MPTFDIDITRIGTGSNTVTVDALNQQEAENLALDQAGDHLYNEKDVEYELTNGRSGDRPGLAAFSTFSDEALVAELRARGAAVCVFAASDIVDSGRAKTVEEAKTFLLSARSKFEDQMTGYGWGIFDSIPEAPQVDEGTFALELECDLWGDVMSFVDPVQQVQIAKDCIDPSKLFEAFVDRMDIIQAESSWAFVENGVLQDEAMAWLRGRGFDFDDGLEVHLVTTPQGTTPTVKVLVQAPMSALLHAPEVPIPDRQRT